MVLSIDTSKLEMISTTKYCDNQQRMVIELIMLHQGQRWRSYYLHECPMIVTAQTDQCQQIVQPCISVMSPSYHCSIDHSLERQVSLCRSASLCEMYRTLCRSALLITSLYRSALLLTSLFPFADQWIPSDIKYLINRYNYNTLACPSPLLYDLL